jgi:hypothetical protein
MCAVLSYCRRNNLFVGHRLVGKKKPFKFSIFRHASADVRALTTFTRS